MDNKFVKCLFKSSAHFFGVSCLLIIVLQGDLYIFQEQVLCQIFNLQILSPSSRLAFSFLGGDVSKSFHFDEI